MSYFSKFPRTTFLGLALVLLAGGAFMQMRLGAAPAKPRIVFLRLTAEYWQLWLMDADGRNARQLTASSVDKHSPSWCPGNDVIHFSTVRGDNLLLDLATGQEHRPVPAIPPLAPPRDLDGNPLPLDVDVRRLLFEKGFEQFADVTCGDDEHPLAEVIEIRAPNALPEGMAIVVQKRLSPELEPIYEINVADIGERANIEAMRSTRLRADARRVISKSGAVAYVSEQSGGNEIWSSKPNELSKRLTDLAANVSNPFWSHDGSVLYFESDFEGTLQIYRALASGEAIQLVSDGKAPSRRGVLSWPVEERATQ